MPLYVHLTGGVSPQIGLPPGNVYPNGECTVLDDTCAKHTLPLQNHT